MALTLSRMWIATTEEVTELPKRLTGEYKIGIDEDDILVSDIRETKYF